MAIIEFSVVLCVTLIPHCRRLDHLCEALAMTTAVFVHQDGCEVAFHAVHIYIEFHDNYHPLPSTPAMSVIPANQYILSSQNST